MKKYLIAFVMCLASFHVSANKLNFDHQHNVEIQKKEFQQVMENDFYEYLTELKAADLYIEPDHRSKVIFERLKNQTIRQHPEAKQWKWEFLGDSQSYFNAFSGVNGKVVLGQDLFDQDLYSDDELAFVIAHEIVHSIKDHARQEFTENYGAVEHIKLSQRLELEADYLALDLVKRAGYNAKKGVVYLKKIGDYYSEMDIEQGESSSHPSITLRYDLLKKHLK